MPDLFPRDGFAVMVAWLSGDPLPPLPVLPGRKFLISDTSPAGEVETDTTETPDASSGAELGG